MQLSVDNIKRLMTALGGMGNGAAVANAINSGVALADQSGASVAAAIVAAHTSTTTDFGALMVGDRVIHIPAAAGNASFSTVVASGTLPQAAVVGDLYVAIRAFAEPAGTTVVL